MLVSLGLPTMRNEPENPASHCGNPLVAWGLSAFLCSSATWNTVILNAHFLWHLRVIQWQIEGTSNLMNAWFELLQWYENLSNYCVYSVWLLLMRRLHIVCYLVLHVGAPRAQDCGHMCRNISMLCCNLFWLPKYYQNLKRTSCEENSVAFSRFHSKPTRKEAHEKTVEK